MSAPFVIPIERLEYSGVIEKRVNYWRETLRTKLDFAPVLVAENPGRPGFWKVYSGADLVAAAKLEGLNALPCSLR